MRTLSLFFRVDLAAGAVAAEARVSLLALGRCSGGPPCGWLALACAADILHGEPIRATSPIWLSLLRELLGPLHGCCLHGAWHQLKADSCAHAICAHAHALLTSTSICTRAQFTLYFAASHQRAPCISESDAGSISDISHVLRQLLRQLLAVRVV
jgi:hypothetical protein